VRKVDEGQIDEIKGEMQLIETHISWVLLGEYVYKIKKPVKFSFLDFSTLEKRKHFCEEEVRLNRRLSHDVYIGVVPIAKNGGIMLEGEGKAIGYAVKMKRLENKMDDLLKQGKVTASQVTEIAAIVADFHGRIESVEGGSPELVRKQIADLRNHRETIGKACGLGEKVDAVVSPCERFIEKNKGLMEKRIAEGKVKDCHGDLHSANIFIDREIRIIDGIEFSTDFRYVDVASEIAFMAMDLDAFGKEDLSKLFVDEYIKRTKDEELRSLLPLYKCYRANVRAKIAAIDYSQHPGEEPKERMRRYLALAERYAALLA
jgi:aminoglycoside phosphotransferase family enzyme